jgi:dTDP-L-rhamnose 4-epimerase
MNIRSLSVLITGGAGFIGSRLALHLLAKGHQVRVLDNLSPQIHGADPECSPTYRTIKGRVEFLHGSVTCESDIAAALDGIDAVVHLAAETGTGQSMYSIRHYSDVNIGGTALLLDMIASGKTLVDRIVVASSRAIYGEGRYSCAEHGFVFPAGRSAERMASGDFSVACPICGRAAQVAATDEDSPARPSSVYGITKLTQEQMVLSVGKALGISAVALRYQNVYGPGQSLSNPYTGILSIFSTRIRNGSPINIFEDGRESRDFVYIDDVVNATHAALSKTEPLVDVFNVGSGVATDVLTIVSTLQRLLGREVPTTVTGQFRLGDIRHNFADLTRIRDAFGFQPGVSVEEGLRRFVGWVRTEPLGVDGYERSLQELKVRGLLK